MDKVPLPKHVAFLLNDAARLLRRRFDQRAQTLGLTRAQWQVLAHLNRNEGISQARLAELMDMEPITLSRHIDRMEAAGWMVRERDPDDRRAHRLYLSPSVRPLLEQMRALGSEVVAEALAGISEAETEQLAAMLEVMRTNLCSRPEPEETTAVAEPAGRHPPLQHAIPGRRAS